jgi:hypothetical protein
MPVYNLTYRSYEGDVRRRFRWAVVTGHELNLVTRPRVTRYLLILSSFHIFLRIMQVIMFDSMASDPRSPVGMFVRNATLLNVDDRMFFDFLRFQSALVFLLMLVAGAGLISNDARHNLLEIYFAKPLTWRDYVFGKLGTLLTLGLGLTALPAAFLALLHVILQPTTDALVKSAWWALESVAFASVIVVPAALGILACSAVARGERQAGLMAALILFVDWFFGSLLADLLHSRNFLILSLPTAIRRIGEVLFKQHRTVMDLPWSVALLAVGLVCVFAALAIVRVARRAERSV